MVYMGDLPYTNVLVCVGKVNSCHIELFRAKMVRHCVFICNLTCNIYL